jgi:hypothetical protein
MANSVSESVNSWARTVMRYVSRQKNSDTGRKPIQASRLIYSKESFGASPMRGGGSANR